MHGLQEVAKKHNQNLMVQGTGIMFNMAFTDLKEAKDYRDTLSFDKAKLGKFVAALHDNGIRVIGRGLWYISAAHTEEDIDKAISIADKILTRIH
jgi:glutamate-1-semialdehyde 2,1-aminomutase